MSHPTEVIMYRNPAEYALWHSGMVFPIMVGAVLAVIAVMVVGWLLQNIEAMTGKRFRGDFSIVAIVVAIATMAGTVAYMT